MNYILNLNLEEVNLILTGLGELPAKQSLEMILKLQKEVGEQIQKSKKEES